VTENIGIGTIIGGFRLKSLIGQGGMGVVYLGEHTQTGVNCAVKLLTPDLARQPGFRERFVREARYANSIDHPNIIEVLDAGEEGEVLYIAMQFVEGRDLKRVMHDEAPLDPARVVHLLGQIASALDAAHRTGLLHRDIKPGNIMVASGAGPEAPEHAYLTDFGLSKNVSSDSIALTAAGEFVGTIDYTAPELVLGKPFDSRLDIYSLGCVMYEALTGQFPFPKERDVEVLYAHIQDPAPSASAVRPDLPQELDAVIQRAMAKDPDDRYPTASAFTEAARAVVGDPQRPAQELTQMKLDVVAGNAQGTAIVVTDEFEIGRHAPGEGKLGSDIEISRQHARIMRDDQGQYVIEDLGSTNGTFVNGARLAAPQVLQVGDRIEVGDTQLVVGTAVAEPATEQHQAPAPPPPPRRASPALARAPLPPPAASLARRRAARAGGRPRRRSAVAPARAPGPGPRGGPRPGRHAGRGGR